MKNAPISSTSVSEKNGESGSGFFLVLSGGGGGRATRGDWDKLTDGGFGIGPALELFPLEAGACGFLIMRGGGGGGGTFRTGPSPFPGFI